MFHSTKFCYICILIHLDSYPQNCLVTDSVKFSTTHSSSYDSLKAAEEEAKRHPSPHVTNNAFYRTSYKQPEVTKYPDGNRAQRRTLSTESYFDIYQHNLPNGGSLSISPVAYHSSRLPDKMSDYEDVWSSPRPIHRHNHKVQNTRVQSKNLCPGFEKKETVDSAGEKKHTVRVFSTEKREKTEYQSKSEVLGSRQIFEFPTKSKGTNGELDYSKVCSSLSNYTTSNRLLESQNKLKKKKSDEGSVKVSTSPSHSTKLFESPQSLVVEMCELGYRGSLDSPSDPKTIQPFLKSPRRFSLTKTFVIEDQNANYVLSQSLTEDESINGNQQQILDSHKPFDSGPQPSRKYSQPTRRGCTSGSATHFSQSIRPEAKAKFTETAMIGEHSFDGIQLADCDDVSKKSQRTVHRSLSECSKMTACNDFRWPTMGRTGAKQTQDTWKPVQECRHSSTLRVSKDLHDIYGTIEQQCGEAPFTISSGFSPAIELRPLTVSEIIGHIAPHLLIRPIRGRSSEDTNPSSLYDNVGFNGTSSPQRTPTSSTYTDYLPPWDDFSVNRLLGRAQGLNQLTAETGADLYIRCLDEMSKNVERPTEETAQRHQRLVSEESQRCQRSLIDDKGQYCQTPSNIDDQFNQRPSINESVAVSQEVLYSNQDRVRGFLNVDLAMCDKTSLGSQENNMSEIQQIKISGGERHDTSKNDEMKALGSRLDEPAGSQYIKQITTRGLETLDVEHCTTIAQTPDHGSVGPKDRDTVRDTSELQGLKRTRGKSTDAPESQSKRKTKSPERVILNAQGTNSLQTLDNLLTPTFQNQRSPSNLTSSGKRRPYPRQLSLPCYLPARTAPLPRLKSSDVVLDDAAFSLDDPLPTLDFRHPCHIRPSTQRRTACLASIPPSISQSPISKINRVSFPRVVQRNLYPVPLSENLVSKNLHIKDEFQSPIQEEEFFGSGSFRYISRKPDMCPTGRDLPSLRIREHQESNIDESRTTTRWTDPEVQEWSSLASKT